MKRRHVEATTVEGVLSPSGVLNHPDAAYCRASGVRLGASQTRRLVRGQRPPMLVVVCDDGSSRSLHRTITIGASPQSDLRLIDDERSVSGQHAVLELHGWDPSIRDVGSRNGTWRQRVSDPAGSWVRLVPQVGHPIEDGDRYVVGRRSIRLRTMW